MKQRSFFSICDNLLMCQSQVAKKVSIWGVINLTMAEQPFFYQEKLHASTNIWQATMQEQAMLEME